MAEELDTEEGTAQGEVTETETEQIEEVFEEVEADPYEGMEGFNKKQLDQMFSATGRIVKQQIEKHVLPHIQKPAEAKTGLPAPSLKEFNQELLDQILSGDVVGALEKVSDVRAYAKKNITKQKQARLTKALTEHSEDPDYKDIYPDAEKIAQAEIAEGMDPKAAARLGLAKARVAHLTGKAGTVDAGKLGVSGNGRRVQRTKVKQLPEAFKKQCAKDIADGIFKDEADYRKSIPLATRQRYGI